MCIPLAVGPICQYFRKAYQESVNKRNRTGPPQGPALGIFRKEGAEIPLAVSSDILAGKKT